MNSEQIIEAIQDVIRTAMPEHLRGYPHEMAAAFEGLVGLQIYQLGEGLAMFDWPEELLEAIKWTMESNLKALEQHTARRGEQHG